MKAETRTSVEVRITVARNEGGYVTLLVDGKTYSGLKVNDYVDLTLTYSAQQG